MYFENPERKPQSRVQSPAFTMTSPLPRPPLDSAYAGSRDTPTINLRICSATLVVVTIKTAALNMSEPTENEVCL